MREAYRSADEEPLVRFSVKPHRDATDSYHVFVAKGSRPWTRCAWSWGWLIGVLVGLLGGLAVVVFTDQGCSVQYQGKAILSNAVESAVAAETAESDAGATLPGAVLHPPPAVVDGLAEIEADDAEWKVWTEVPDFVHVKVLGLPADGRLSLHTLYDIVIEYETAGLTKAQADKVTSLLDGVKLEPYVRTMGYAVTHWPVSRLSKTAFSASLYFRDPGTHDLDVHTRHYKPARSYAVYQGPRVTLHVGDGDAAVSAHTNEQRDQFPASTCAAWTDQPGRWIRCDRLAGTAAAESCMKPYGWAWVPYDCHYPMFTPKHLAATDMWIVYVGTSVHRGSMFTAMDHILGPRGSNIVVGRPWKCWGQMHFTAGKLKMSYVDSRLHLWDRLPEETSPDYANNSLALIADLTSRDPAPDVIHLELWQIVRSKLGEQIKAMDDLIAHVNPKWNGILLLSLMKPIAFQPFSQYYETADSIHKHILQKHADNPRVRFVPDRRHAEGFQQSGQAQGLSLHYHDDCTGKKPGRTVLGPASEMTFMMTMQTACTHTGKCKDSMAAATGDGPWEGDFTYCTECPDAFEPHIMYPTLVPGTCHHNVIPGETGKK